MIGNEKLKIVYRTHRKTKTTAMIGGNYKFDTTLQLTCYAIYFLDGNEYEVKSWSSRQCDVIFVERHLGIIERYNSGFLLEAIFDVDKEHTIIEDSDEGT